MAKQTILKSNDTWEQIASGVATFTVEVVGTGTFFINDSAIDENAITFTTRFGKQFKEDEERTTFIKVVSGSDSSKYKIVVDGAIS